MTALVDEVADVLTMTRYEPVLFALFRRGKAVWTDLDGLCAEAGVARPPGQRRITVAWLDDPDATPGYVLVMFICPAEIQSFFGVYNRARLLRS